MRAKHRTQNWSRYEIPNSSPPSETGKVVGCTALSWHLEKRRGTSGKPLLKPMKDHTNQLEHMKTTLAVERHKASGDPRLVGTMLCLLLWAGTVLAQTSATSISFQGPLNCPDGR
jgi:hypothetical protein